jgi:peptidoglycan/LPS O-acetylase OafA/YrhL
MILVGTRARPRYVVAGLVATIAVIGIHRWLLWEATSVARVVLGTDTHADGLMFGALLAHVRAWRPTARLPRPALLIAAALLGATAALVKPGAAFLFRGGYTLVGAAAAVVIASAVGGDRLATGALARRPLLAIGRVSYGLYLWHPLVFWWVFVELHTRSDTVRFFAGVVATAVATSASWYLVERPFLRWKSRLESVLPS